MGSWTWKKMHDNCFFLFTFRRILPLVMRDIFQNSNTEYVPTKCRVTRPPPPKPATNPLQFVKVAPPPLFKKAQEQIKKVEEIKKERKEIRDETEDWQQVGFVCRMWLAFDIWRYLSGSLNNHNCLFQNLDNWKSCRRKRQEHIIERVVEVKKLTEQEELEKAKRKSKTFSEMLEERSVNKFCLPLFWNKHNFCVNETVQAQKIRKPFFLLITYIQGYRLLDIRYSSILF